MGEAACAASVIPRSPPIDVPIQPTLSAPLRAISAVSTVRYVGKA